MRCATLGLLFLALAGCLTRPAKPTLVTAKTAQAEVSLSSDATTQQPPKVETNTEMVTIPLPPKARVIVTELVTSPTQPEAKRVVVEMPDNAGAEIKVSNSTLKAVGSVGQEAPPPPSPFEKSISVWTYAGVALFALGIFFVTPWGGSNYRVGALIAGGGVVMSLLGVFLNELSQYKIPGWVPAVGFLGVAAAIFLYWGYKHRQRQESSELTTTKATSDEESSPDRN